MLLIITALLRLILRSLFRARFLILAEHILLFAAACDKHQLGPGAQLRHPFLNSPSHRLFIDALIVITRQRWGSTLRYEPAVTIYRRSSWRSQIAIVGQRVLHFGRFVVVSFRHVARFWGL